MCSCFWASSCTVCECLFGQSAPRPHPHQAAWPALAYPTLSIRPHLSLPGPQSHGIVLPEVFTEGPGP